VALVDLRERLGILASFEERERRREEERGRQRREREVERREKGTATEESGGEREMITMVRTLQT